jgi:hypothetical protein
MVESTSRCEGGVCDSGVLDYSRGRRGYVSNVFGSDRTFSSVVRLTNLWRRLSQSGLGEHSADGS